MLTSITFVAALAAIALGIIVGYLSARKDNRVVVSEAMLAGFDAGVVIGQKLMMSQAPQGISADQLVAMLGQAPKEEQADKPPTNKIGFRTTPRKSNKTKDT